MSRGRADRQTESALGQLDSCLTAQTPVVSAGVLAAIDTCRLADRRALVSTVSTHARESAFRAPDGHAAITTYTY